MLPTMTASRSICSRVPTISTSIPSVKVSCGPSGTSILLRRTRVMRQVITFSAAKAAMLRPMRFGWLTRTTRVMIWSGVRAEERVSSFRSLCSRRGRSCTKSTTPTTPKG